MAAVYYVAIKPSSSGFGLYDTSVDTEPLDDADILDGCAGEVWEIGTDDLPDWVEDIRGRIHGEPDRLFVERSNDQSRITYFGFNLA